MCVWWGGYLQASVSKALETIDYKIVTFLPLLKSLRYQDVFNYNTIISIIIDIVRGIFK